MHPNKTVLSFQNSLSNTQSLKAFGLKNSDFKSRLKRNSELLENGRLNDTLSSSSSQYTPLSTNSRKRRHTTQHSTFTPRKITHFSIFPSPYRPTGGINVFQTITATPSLEPESEKPAEVLEIDKKPAEVLKIDEKPKKISMTATAMLSLIDEPEDSEVEVVSFDSKPLKKFVNPYASTASKSTPRSTPPKLIRKTTTSPTSVIDNLERTMPSKNKPPTKETITKSNLEKFKPVQSSSLRQSVLSNSTTKNTFDHAKRHDTTSTAIIQSKAAHTWSVPEFFDDEMDLDEEETTKTNEVSSDSLKLSTLNSTPTESKPFVFKSAEVVPDAKQSFVLDSASKLDNKMAQETPIPVVNGTKTFTFESPASNKSGSFNSQSKSSAPDTTTTVKLSTSVPPVTQQVATVLHPKVESVKEPSINAPQFNFSTPPPLFGSKPNTITSTTSTSVDSVTAPSLFASKLVSSAPVSVSAAVVSTKVTLPIVNGTLKNSDTEKIKKYSSLFQLPTTSVAIPPPIGSEKKIQELKELFKF